MRRRSSRTSRKTRRKRSKQRAGFMIHPVVAAQFVDAATLTLPVLAGAMGRRMVIHERTAKKRQRSSRRKH
jgi:hypothetical protein